MMKAPGKDGYIVRRDFENSAKDYFKDLRALEFTVTVCSGLFHYISKMFNLAAKICRSCQNM
ncbi:unnamed protein product [Brassica oleracea var. botrytis]